MSLLSGLGPACIAGAVFAQTDDAAPLRDVRISGFGTLGVTHDDAPHGWGLRRDLMQPGSSAGLRADVDSRLGLQVNYSPSERVELVTQLLAVRRGRQATRGDAFEWAYANWRPTAEWALRIGRINLDAFLMADYRNVGFGYPMARPPIEFYGVLPSSLDGADVARTWIRGDVHWRAKLFSGRGRFGDWSGSRAKVRDTIGVMASRESAGLLMRASFAQGTVRPDQSAAAPLLDALGMLATLPLPSIAAEAAALRSALDLWGARGRFFDVGLRYEFGSWLTSVELTRLTGHETFGMHAGYVSVGRRFGDVTAFTTVSAARSLRPPRAAPAWLETLAPLLGASAAAQAQALGAAAAAGADSGRVRQSTMSFGARWDLHSQAALKLQWDRTRVGAIGSRQWSDATPHAGKVDVWTLLLDFVF